MNTYEIHVAVNACQNKTQIFTQLLELGFEVEWVHEVINFEGGDALTHRTGHDLPTLRIMATGQSNDLAKATAMAIAGVEIASQLGGESNLEIERLDCVWEDINVPIEYANVPDSPCAEAHFGITGRYCDLDINELFTEIFRISGSYPHQAVCFTESYEVADETTVSWFFTVYQASSEAAREFLASIKETGIFTCVIAEAVLLVAAPIS